MKFLEEIFLEGKAKSFSKRKFKIWAGTKLLYKKSQIKDQKEKRELVTSVVVEKKPREGRGKVSRRRHSKNRAWRLWDDLVTIVSLTKTSGRTQGDRSWRRTSCQHCKEEKSSMKRNWRVIWNLQSKSCKLYQVKSFLILSYHCIRYWKSYVVRLA